MKEEGKEDMNHDRMEVIEKEGTKERVTDNKKK